MNTGRFIAVTQLRNIEPGDCFMFEKSLFLVTQMHNKSKDTRTVASIFDGKLLCFKKSKAVRPVECVVEVDKKYF